MAKLGGMNGLGGGFAGMNPIKPGLKGGVANSGGLSGKGIRMQEKQGAGGVQAKNLGQTQTSVGAAGQKMDDRSGKGVVAKGVGQIQTSTGGGGQKMGTPGKGN